MIVCVLIGGPGAGWTKVCEHPPRIIEVPAIDQNEMWIQRYELQSTPGNVAEYKPVKHTQVAP